MSAPHVIVVGGGVAGAAAAFAASKSGARVTVVLGHPGATCLGPGALDGGPDLTADADVRAFVDALDAYALGPAIVATQQGVLRGALGIDRALLDLAPIERGVVLVPRFTRLGWDADAIAWALSAHPLAASRGLEIRAIDAGLARLAEERIAPDATIAARHDDDTRLAWLGERLLHASASGSAEGARAWLLPPWLGMTRERASALAQRVKLPCGEIAVGLAGPAGFRFASARDRAFAALGVTSLTGFAERARAEGHAVRVVLESGDTLIGDALVLATGGLVGGGLVYQPSESQLSGELPSEPRPWLRTSVGDGPVGVRGQSLVVPGSMFGRSPETLTWPFVEDGDLERAGLLTGPRGRVRDTSRTFAAGEVAADVPRTWLDSAKSGLEAGAAAATLARP